MTSKEFSQDVSGSKLIYATTADEAIEQMPKIGTLWPSTNRRVVNYQVTVAPFKGSISKFFCRKPKKSNWIVQWTLGVQEWSAEAFEAHFRRQPGIDHSITSHALIDALSEYYVRRHALTFFDAPRGSGVTRTLSEWSKWIEGDVLVITSCSHWYKEFGISTRSWRSPIKGLRPDIVLIDAPLTRIDQESAVTMAQFARWLRIFPYPAFFARQFERTPT